MKSPVAVPTVRPFPYVSGETRRIKAEPTKLTGVAARVMAASGNFSTKRGAAPSSPALYFGALVLLLAAGMLAVASGDARTGAREAGALGQQFALVQSLLPTGTAESPAATAPEAAPAAPEVTLDAQDRFEIARLFHLTAHAVATASQELAPAAGPSPR